jgi:hypothetical protein
MKRSCGRITISLILIATAAVGQDRRDTGRLEGTVVDGNTSIPLSNVRIQITPGNVRASTDSMGRFALDSLAPGPYTLIADKGGYMTARPAGRRIPGNAGIPFIVIASRPVRLVVAMFPAAIVSGRVLDTSGKPVQDAIVRPFRYVYNDAGERSPRYFAPFQTNDLGEFRFSNLDPGEYLFQADPPPQRRESLATSSLQRAYYRGGRTPEDALLLTLRGGVETRLDDIQLQPSRLGMLRIRFNVEDGISRQESLRVYFRLNSDIEVRTVAVPADASMTQISPLIPGQYYVEANSLGANPRSGSAIVEVQEGQTELNLVLRRDAAFSGHVWSQGSTGQRRPLPGVSVQIVHPSRSGRLPFKFTSDETGRLTGFSSALPLGQYRVNVLDLPANHYLVAIKERDLDVLTDGLLLDGSHDPELTVILGEGTGVVRGIAKEAGAVVPGAVVALIPDNRGLKHLFKAAVADANGFFELHGAPGSYHVYSWSELDGAAYWDPMFMRKYDAQGYRVQLAAGVETSIEVAVLSPEF